MCSCVQQPLVTCNVEVPELDDAQMMTVSDDAEKLHCSVTPQENALDLMSTAKPRADVIIELAEGVLLRRPILSEVQWAAPFHSARSKRVSNVSTT